MTIAQIVLGVLGMISGLPAIAQPVAYVVAILIPVGAAATTVVAVLHAVVLALEAVAKIPGCTKIQKIADTLSADVDVAGNLVNNDIAPFIQQLSLLPLPKNPAPAVAPAKAA